ncbi:MAG TPA: M3 family metallopeptidase, partial [Lunatimonas sp.]|nr:M3 family metallopeptidase [Lunatimonas sp.]
GIMAQGKYESLSGTNVYWDFVELPSQIFENWCYEKECLDLFARHHDTGAKIPEELIMKLKKAANFQQGYQTVRQISFGLLDMAFHSSDPKEIEDILGFEKNLMEKTELLPAVPETSLSTSFSHIFQGGYAAGYYSYKWAEVLDADAFELFLERGIFDKKTSEAFATHILSAGGKTHPNTLYKRFRGRSPKPEALLRRAGLISSKDL